MHDQFVIEVFTNRDAVTDKFVTPHWSKTIWTKGPVSRRVADKALLRAHKAFPKSQYRIVPA